MKHLLEILEQYCTLACAVTARANEFDLYYWKFERIEVPDLPRRVALAWLEGEIAQLGYAGSLKEKIAREILRLAGGNPGSLAQTLEILRRQDVPLDDPVRVRRIFVDCRLNHLQTHLN